MKRKQITKSLIFTILTFLFYQISFISVSAQTGTAEIKAKILDEDLNPVPNVYIELYPDLPNLTFTNLGYFRLGKSDEKGNFVLKRLPKGNYIIGIRLGSAPDFENPYRRTFYPGEKELKDAQIIGVREGEKLEILPFIVPKALKTVKIKGKLVWEDGLVVKNPFANTGKQTIYISLLNTNEDPTGFQSIASAGIFSYHILEDEKGFRISRQFIITDELSNFTLWAFDGYSYILNAHAYDSEKKVMKYCNLVITAKENMEPLVLKLSNPGSGNDRQTLRNSLEESKNKLPQTQSNCMKNEN